jgi:hypothetical protein
MHVRRTMQREDYKDKRMSRDLAGNPVSHCTCIRCYDVCSLKFRRPDQEKEAYKKKSLQTRSISNLSSVSSDEF